MKYIRVYNGNAVKLDTITTVYWHDITRSYKDETQVFKRVLVGFDDDDEIWISIFQGDYTESAFDAFQYFLSDESNVFEV